MSLAISLRPVDLDNSAEGLLLRNMYIRLQLFDAQASGNNQIAFPLGQGAKYLAAMRQRREMLQANANLDFIVASNAVIGFVCAGANTRNLGEGAGALNQLYIVPARRGQGIGRSALRLTHDFLSERGCRTAILGMAYRNIPARRLYQTEGWACIGPSPQLPGYERWQKTLG